MGGRGGSSGFKPVNLKGSEKQVSWAKEIRSKFEKVLDSINTPRRVASLANEMKKHGYEITVPLKELQSVLKKELNKIDDAKWFINRRNDTYDYALAELISDKTGIFKKRKK